MLGVRHVGGARCVASEVSPGGSRGDGKGEGRQAQSFKGKTRRARDQGWAAEREVHFTAVEGDRKGQAAGRAGADWSGWSVLPWKRPGGNWSEDQGGGSGKSCVPGWHSDCTQVSRGVCVPRAPPLPCRGAPTRPLPLQRPHDPLPRPPAQPRLTPVLEPRAPERLGLPSVWAGPGRGWAQQQAHGGQETWVLPAKSSQSGVEDRIVTHVNLGPQLRRHYVGVRKAGRRGI